MPKVKLPTQLREAAGGESAVSVEGGTVGAVLDALFERHSELRDRLSDGDGALRRFVNVYVDGEDIRFGDGLDTPVADGQEVTTTTLVKTHNCLGRTYLIVIMPFHRLISRTMLRQVTE